MQGFHTGLLLYSVFQMTDLFVIVQATLLFGYRMKKMNYLFLLVLLIVLAGCA